MKTILIGRDGGLQWGPDDGFPGDPPGALHRTVFFAAVPKLRLGDAFTEQKIPSVREVAYEKLDGLLYLNGHRMYVYLEKP